MFQPTNKSRHHRKSSKEEQEMARIIKTIEIEGQPAVALFDSGVSRLVIKIFT